MWNLYRLGIGSSIILTCLITFIPSIAVSQAVFPDELLDTGSARRGTVSESDKNKKKDTKKSTSETTKTPKVNPYVRMFFERPGTEIELFIDPGFSDVNLDVEIQQSSTTIKTDQQPENVEDKIKKMLDSYLKPKEKESEKSAEGKEEEPAKESGKKAGKQASMPAETSAPDNITSAALSNIYKAQKYFYVRNFNQALVEVQNSLDQKETALGYALQGSIYFQMGQKDAAANSWRSALAIDPNLREVRDILRVYESQQFQRKQIIVP